MKDLKERPLLDALVEQVQVLLRRVELIEKREDARVTQAEERRAFIGDRTIKLEATLKDHEDSFVALHERLDHLVKVLTEHTGRHYATLDPPKDPHPTNQHYWLELKTLAKWLQEDIMDYSNAATACQEDKPTVQNRDLGIAHFAKAKAFRIVLTRVEEILRGPLGRE